MLHASLPFDAKNIQHTFEKIEAGLYAPVRRGLSVDAQNLIMRFLQPNPMHRITVEKALVHPWLRTVSPMVRGGSVPDIHRPTTHAELFRPLSAASALRQSGLTPSAAQSPEIPAAAGAIPDNDSNSSVSSDSESSLSSASSLDEVAQVLASTTVEPKANLELSP